MLRLLLLFILAFSIFQNCYNPYRPLYSSLGSDKSAIHSPISAPQVKLRHADQEIRLAQDPFPLYSGEILKQVVTPLKVVQANTALRIRSILDFEEEDGTKRVAGDEWLFEGPGEGVAVEWAQRISQYN